jgi:phosphoribosyl 1,2-cyclic phosphate phosphodiesterase
MSGLLEVTILGCGSSAGVPRADGAWGKCDPANPRNRRSRCSMAVRRKATDGGDETTVLVDTSPDLRLQASSAGLRRLDAVLYTHDHADQAHGIDDLRGFYLSGKRRTPCYMDAVTHETLTTRFHYIFEDKGGYPAICDARALPDYGVAWEIDGPSGPIPVIGYDQDHGGIRSLGYRFGPVGYSSDVVGLPAESLEALQGVEVFIIDALRDQPHPTHANVAQALDWIEALSPARGILTNLHFDLDYDALSKRLPPNVVAAYDGMRFEVGI